MGCDELGPLEVLKSNAPQCGHQHLGHQHPVRPLRLLHQQEEVHELPRFKLWCLAACVVHRLEAEVLGGPMVHRELGTKGGCIPLQAGMHAGRRRGAPS